MCSSDLGTGAGVPSEGKALRIAGRGRSPGAPGSSRPLEEDIKSGGNSFMYKSPPNQMEINQKITQSESYQLHVQNANGSIQHIELNRFSATTSALSKNTIIRASEKQQKKLLKRYEYQAGVIDDVLYSMIYTPNLKPIDERVDFKVLNNYIK